VNLPRPLQSPGLLADLTEEDQEASARNYTGKVLIELDYKDGRPVHYGVQGVKKTGGIGMPVAVIVRR